MSRIVVLGAGAWGTAIALSLAKPDRHSVMLWCHRSAAAEALQTDRENRRFLPGFPFPPSLDVTASDAEAITDAEILVCAVPSQFLRPTFARLAPHLGLGTIPSRMGSQIIVSATKGIEDQTYLRTSQVIDSCLGEHGVHLPIGVLSGPSFAQEVAAGRPTAVTVAFADPSIATRVQADFSGPALRLYTNDDIIGVEMGGALKNVIAIASGVCTGLGLGLNSSAALITRGIAEITRLAVAAGARRDTLGGLSGLGDLVLTCTGGLSRNRTVGMELGRGRSLPEILSGLDGKVAEGIRTTRAALGMARRLGVEMPIAEQVELILDHGKGPKEAIRDLMQRPARDED